jgi:hypothetical protein
MNFFMNILLARTVAGAREASRPTPGSFGQNGLFGPAGDRNEEVGIKK